MTRACFVCGGALDASHAARVLPPFGLIEVCSQQCADDPKFSLRIDPVVEAVRADLLERSARGIAKYNATLARTDLSLRNWLQYAYEEALDQANYLKRAILEIEASEKPVP